MLTVELMDYIKLMHSFFTTHMLEKMLKRCTKRGDSWKTCTIEQMIDRIYDEIMELEKAKNHLLTPMNLPEMYEECVDIANQAMLLADVLERRWNEDHSTFIWEGRFSKGSRSETTLSARRSACKSLRPSVVGWLLT